LEGTMMKFYQLFARRDRRASSHARTRRRSGAIAAIKDSGLELLEGRALMSYGVGSPEYNSNGLHVQYTELKNDRIEAVISHSATASGPISVAVATYKNATLSTDSNNLWNIFNQEILDEKTAVLRPGDTVTFTLREDKDAGKCTQIDTYVDRRVLSGQALKDLAPDRFKDPAFLQNVLNTTYVVGMITCNPPETPKGNEGLGNGIDPPPPGHLGDLFQNDDSGIPGSPNLTWNKKNKT